MRKYFGGKVMKKKKNQFNTRTKMSAKKIKNWYISMEDAGLFVSGILIDGKEEVNFFETLC